MPAARVSPVAGDLLHVVVGHGLPGLYLNTLESFRAILPDAPLLVVDNASPQGSLRERLREIASGDPAMELVLRERNESANGKVGGLYEAYRLAFDRAFQVGARYVHLMQADMQLLWWDDDVMKRAEDLWGRHRSCVNIMTVALSKDRWLTGDLRTDPSTGDTLLASYGLTDTGLYHLGRFKDFGACFESTEDEHAQRAREAGLEAAVFAWPTEVQVPWPAVVRHGKQRGREIRTTKPLLCKPLSTGQVASLKAATRPINMEDICVPWGWSCLSPMWNTDLDNVYYLALRRRDLAVNGWRDGLPRWVTSGLDRPTDILLRPHRPSLIALVAQPLWSYLRARYGALAKSPRSVKPAISVLAAPRDDNPYQELLYTELRKVGVPVRYDDGPTASQTLNVVLAPVMLAWYRLSGYRVLHLHWVFQFSLPWARRALWARRAMQWWFELYLRVASALQFALVWTAHDLVPHEPVFADDERVHKVLASSADVVISLSGASAKELRRWGAKAVRTVPLGAYAEPALAEPAPPKPAPAEPVSTRHASPGPDITPHVATARDSAEVREDDRESTRAALGWAPHETVVVHLGKILPYKGADTLLVAARLLPPEIALRAVVVGACKDEEHAHLLERLARELGPQRAQLRLQRVSDEDMARYLRCADIAAFPFREVTNSSSLLHAQCYGLPAVIPDLPSLGDVPVSAVLRYDGTANGLAEALVKFSRLGEQERRLMGEAGRAWATSADWAEVARMTLEAYEAATQARSRRPKQVARRAQLAKD